MIDKTPDPRKIAFSVQILESLLAAAMEHASHGWHALETETRVNRINPDAWPPQVEAPVGSAQYHLSITLVLLFEAFQAIRAEGEHTRDVMDLVNKALKDRRG